MTNRERVFHAPSMPAFGDDRGVLAADRLASEVKARWRTGEIPDTNAVLAQHPELLKYRSIALDLAYEEYARRLEAGESPDAETFSRRFPTLQRSLYLLIEVQTLMDQDPAARLFEDSIRWPQPGESFLGFALIGELGRGTFGRVYLASEPALGDRLVALKVTPEGGQEAEILGKLQHPNIMPVYSVREDTTSGLTAICTPYLGRATLCDVLDRAFGGPWPPTKARIILDTVQEYCNADELSERLSHDRILRYGTYVDGVIHLAIQLADALADTHARGICHRDLKPSNILLSFDARPLLLDFNLSSDELVTASRIGGTLPYMAPEQLRSVVLDGSTDGDQADPRSDLYSLGVILYELLSGSHPFGVIPWDRSLEGIAEHLIERQKKRPESVQLKNPLVDKRTAELLLDCLAFDPACRPQSADVLSAAFRKQAKLVWRGKRWVGNHPRRAMTFAAVMLLLVSAGVGFFIFRAPYSVRQFQHGLKHFERGQYELAKDYFDDSVRSDPKNWDALVVRARTYQQLENFSWAFEDFESAYRLKPTAGLIASKAYCLARLKHHDEALSCNRKALEDGHETAAVLNNTGFCYVQLRQLDRAEEYLRRAIEADENLQAPHHSLAFISLNRAYGGQPVSLSALTHAKTAIDIGPPSVDLYCHAAALSALAARRDPSLMPHALEYLERAIDCGFDPKSLASHPAFVSLHGQRAFEELLASPSPSRRPIKADLLVEPF